MTAPTTLVVAVLTYRRPAQVAALVPELAEQALALTRAGVCSSVLVVDNDPHHGSRSALEPLLGPHLGVDVRLVHEPAPGIAAARNRALEESADRDLLVFIDDDERPAPGWLHHLVETRTRYDAAAVAGRVTSRITGELDPWIAAGGFFERRHRHGLATGTAIPTAATNNLLLDLRAVRELGLRFDGDFGLSGGEDSLFTRTLTASGRHLVWCADAVVTDQVPADRVTRRWVLLRAVSSGNSEARVALRLAATGHGPGSGVTRLRLLAAGAGRLAGGLLAVAAGRLGGSLPRRARGWRTAARGMGLAGGALGWTYLEYRRTAPHPAPQTNRAVA